MPHHQLLTVLTRAYLALALPLRRALRALGDLLVPSPVPLYELAAGVVHTQVLASFVELGLADALQGRGQGLAAMAERTGTEPQMLARLLRMGEAIGLVARRRNGHYRATRLARALQTDRATSVAAFATYFASASNVAAWGGLTGVVRTGTDAFTSGEGQSVWSHFQAAPAEEATFAKAMAALAELEGPLVARAYPFGRHRLLYDVGGGSGTFLRTVLRLHSNLRGVVVDQASVVEAAVSASTSVRGAAVASGTGGQGDAQGAGQGDLVEAGARHLAHLAGERAKATAYGNRLTFVAGNFFEHVPTGADAYILRQILHDWDDVAAGVILRQCRRAMGPTTRLLIIDARLEAGDAAYPLALKDLTMAVVCGGHERSRAGMVQLLTASGLRLVKIWRTPASVVVWEVARGAAAATKSPPPSAAKLALQQRPEPRSRGRRAAGC